jgi:adenosine deaminase
VPFATVLAGITRALDEAAAAHGLTSRLIMCFLRDLDAGDAMATLDEGLKHLDRIAGVGLDSAERGNPPGKFKAVFARAREAGLRAVAHAGEEGPAAYVAEALDVLKVARIDHGNAVLDDPALTARIAAAGIPLTVCPLSNLRLRVVDDMAAHPLKRMLAAGLKVTVNSDDPAYFGGYVNANYRAVETALGLGRDALALIARNAFEAAFLEEDEAAAYLTELGDFVSGTPADD